jgi:hypothetical protein
LLCTVLFCAILAPGARADQWDKKTVVTFGEAVEIPGQVLPAAICIFKPADTISDQHIVQVWNADESQVLAMIMTISKTRSEPHDRTIFELNERSGDSPMADKVWFYPGNSTGEEFTYSGYSYMR